MADNDLLPQFSSDELLGLMKAQANEREEIARRKQAEANALSSEIESSRTPSSQMLEVAKLYLPTVLGYALAGNKGGAAFADGTLTGIQYEDQQEEKERALLEKAMQSAEKAQGGADAAEIAFVKAGLQQGKASKRNEVDPAALEARTQALIQLGISPEQAEQMAVDPLATNLVGADSMSRRKAENSGRYMTQIERREDRNQKEMLIKHASVVVPGFDFLLDEKGQILKIPTKKEKEEVQKMATEYLKTVPILDRLRSSFDEHGSVFLNRDPKKKKVYSSRESMFAGLIEQLRKLRGSGANFTENEMLLAALQAGKELENPFISFTQWAINKGLGRDPRGAMEELQRQIEEGVNSGSHIRGYDFDPIKVREVYESKKVGVNPIAEMLGDENSSPAPVSQNKAPSLPPAPTPTPAPAPLVEVPGLGSVPSGLSQAEFEAWLEEQGG